MLVALRSNVVLVVAPETSAAYRLGAEYRAVQHRCVGQNTTGEDLNRREVLRFILNAHGKLVTLVDVELAVWDYVSVLARATMPVISGSVLDKFKEQSKQATIATWDSICAMLKAA